VGTEVSKSKTRQEEAENSQNTPSGSNKGLSHGLVRYAELGHSKYSVS